MCDESLVPGYSGIYPVRDTATIKLLRSTSLFCHPEMFLLRVSLFEMLNRSISA